MQEWKDLYTELCGIVADNIPAIKWQDLWHNQINFLEDEHQFPSPAVFYYFRTINTKDQGNKSQKQKIQVGCYLFFETMADTYHESWNQGDALGFLNALTDLQKFLHGAEGENFSNMRHVGMTPVDTGSAGNLYLKTFECELIDYSATPQDEIVDVQDLNITAGERPEPEEEENSFFPD